jgi:methionyl-tRNA formyltransferase
MSAPKLVFMGTPEFAVPSLKILLENGYEVLAVVCPPDKPSGRGMKLQACAVKQFALEQNLLVLQPEKLRGPLFLEQLKALEPDLQVVVAFRMLPDVVWKLPKIGTFNLHGSLLPQYRGAAPINHAVIDGCLETGVTTFMIDEKIDTGAMLLSASTPIAENDTAGDVHDRLMELGATLVLKTVQGLEKGLLVPQPQPQDSSELRPAPKIFKEFCLLDANLNVQKAHNFIRGLAPYPTAYTLYKGQAIKLFQAEQQTPLLPQHTSVANGTLLSDGKSFIVLKLSDGYLNLLKLQLPNKKVLPAKELLLGYKEFDVF